MREFTLFAAQRKLANRNLAAASVRRNEQRGVLLQVSFSSLPSSPLPNTRYAFLCSLGYNSHQPQQVSVDM